MGLFPALSIVDREGADESGAVLLRDTLNQDLAVELLKLVGRHDGLVIVTHDVHNKVFIRAGLQLEVRALRGEVPGEIVLDGIVSEKVLKAQLVELAALHAPGPFETLSLVEVFIYFTHVVDYIIFLLAQPHPC